MRRHGYWKEVLKQGGSGKCSHLQASACSVAEPNPNQQIREPMCQDQPPRAQDSAKKSGDSIVGGKWTLIEHLYLVYFIIPSQGEQKH